MIKVLYADDEPDIREIAEMALGLDPDLAVRTAGSGEEAIRVAREWLPAIVLLDVMMPQMDGPETLSRLRSYPETLHIPVAFVTARAQRSEIQNFAMLDAVGVIAKPFDPISLAVQVRKLIP